MKRIGLFLISDKTGYQRLLADDGLRAARQAGVELDVFSADDTSAQQSAQVVHFLHTRAEDELGVVMMPVSDIGHEQALERLARRVLSRRVAWILLNRDVESHVEHMRAEYPGLPLCLVTIDNLEVGRIQGRQVKTLLRGGGGPVLCVLGNVLTSAARDRRAGLLDAAGSAMSLSEVEALWSADSAEKVVARWLSYSTPSALLAVACQNDPMAVGARQALHRAGRELKRPEWLQVPVLGVDGVPSEGQRLVDERTLAATVVLPPSSGPAVDLLVQAWRSPSAIPAKVVLQPRAYPA